MLVKFLVAVIGSGPVGIAVAPDGAGAPTPEQFYESCWSSLSSPQTYPGLPASSEPAQRMHAVCDAVYAQLTGQVAEDASHTAFAQDLNRDLAALPAAQHTPRLVSECRRIVGERQDVCTKIEYVLMKQD